MQGIYDDLDVHPDLDVEFKKLQQINKALNLHFGKLEAEVARLGNELDLMKNVQKTLGNHISSLFLTARAEINRKERMNMELRKQIDDLERYSMSGKTTSSSSRSRSPANSIKDFQYNKNDMCNKVRKNRHGIQRRNMEPRDRSYHRRHSPNRPKSSLYIQDTDYNLKSYEDVKKEERYKEKDIDRHKSSSSKRQRLEEKSLINKRSKAEHKEDTESWDYKSTKDLVEKPIEKIIENDDVKVQVEGVIENTIVNKFDKSYEEGEILEDNTAPIDLVQPQHLKDDVQKIYKKSKNLTVNKDSLKPLPAAIVDTGGKTVLSTERSTKIVYQKEPVVETPKLVTSFEGCINRDKPNDLIMQPHSSINAIHNSNKASNSISLKFSDFVKKADENPSNKCRDQKDTSKSQLHHSEYQEKHLAVSNQRSSSTSGNISSDTFNLNPSPIAGSSPGVIKASESSELRAFRISKSATIATSKDKDLAIVENTEGEIPISIENKNVTINESSITNATKGKPRPKRRGGVVTMI